MILGHVDEAVSAGARQSKACEELELDPRTVQRWKRQGVGDDGRAGPKEAPKNKLSKSERRKILAVVNLSEYRNLSIKQIVPRLGDLGEYYASESTMYRVLREADQLKHRQNSRSPQQRSGPPSHTASGPCQVWSWDITYLKAPVRGQYFYLYLMMDIWSRKIVGWCVHEQECSEYASLMMEEACAREGVEANLILHSDRGSPMKGATLLATLQDLGVMPSYSRPRVCDDNPYSESLFRTTKSRPGYPAECFESLEAAIEWVRAFVDWYNGEHLHSGIGFVTPAQRHCGEAPAILHRRKKVWEAARKQHPERWARHARRWDAPELVHLVKPKDGANDAA